MPSVASLVYPSPVGYVEPTRVSAIAPPRKPGLLIVDDQALMRRFLMAALASGGAYDLYEAEDGMSAQAALKKHRIDVVITDVVMPGMDGLALMRWAKVNCPGPTWIIHSGLDTFNAAVEAIHLGAFDFLSKPLYSVQLLEVTVRNALNQRELMSEREKLHSDLQERNSQLREQVAQLEDVCTLLQEQATIIQQDIRRAENIQRALLPQQAPTLRGFSVDTIFRPSHNIGGDLYDIVRIGDRHVVAYIADSAGHGVSAAMLSVFFKHRLKMAVDDVPVSPLVALQSVNQALLSEAAVPGLFVTAAYALLDTVTREVVVASAGHPPVMLHCASGQVIRIEHTGPALGLRADAEFGERRFLLNDGDRLLLYTDGLYDASQAPDHVTTEDISDTLAHGSRTGAVVLAQLLESAARRRGPSELDEDDVTLLLLSSGNAPSTLDNGVPESHHPASSTVPSCVHAEVLCGSRGGAAILLVRGRGTWVFCDTFHEACFRALDARQRIVIDLSECLYLDSTFLGTLHDIAVEADHRGVPIRFQGVRSEVTQLFEELCMAAVLERISPETEPLPEAMVPLTESADDSLRSRRRVLRAHEILASLSEQNREQFMGVVEALRAEMGQS